MPGTGIRSVHGRSCRPRNRRLEVVTEERSRWAERVEGRAFKGAEVWEEERSLQRTPIQSSRATGKKPGEE